MKDWLGNEYDVGDKVIYAAGSGRSITMVLAEVVKIRKVCRDPDSWNWVEIGLDEEAPFKTMWNHDTRQREPTDERETTEFRVTVQPLNSSRWQQHHEQRRFEDKRTGQPIKNPYSEEHWLGAIDQHFKDHVREIKSPPKPVTLMVTENIVLWQKKDDARESHPEWAACKR